MVKELILINAKHLFVSWNHLILGILNQVVLYAEMLNNGDGIAALNWHVQSKSIYASIAEKGEFAQFNLKTAMQLYKMAADNGDHNSLEKYNLILNSKEIKDEMKKLKKLEIVLVN